MKVQVSDVAKLPSIFGKFNIQCFKDEIGKEHLAIFKDEIKSDEVLNVRIHSECLTGDALGSLKCDCREQLISSLEFIEKNGGMVIYHRQEGRNIGLFNKVNAYHLQDEGMNTIDANLHLGFQADERNYDIVNYIFAYYKIKEINLLTNNPIKIEAIKDVKVNQRVKIIMKANKYNKDYLNVKEKQMGHMLNEN